MPNIDDLIRDHVTLEVECLDRLYLNGYVPTLQTGGQLVTFLIDHLHQPIPSPALLGKLTGRFVENGKRFVEENQVPFLRFAHGERKDDIANDFRRKSAVKGGVVFVGLAPEKAQAFVGKKKERYKTNLFLNPYRFKSPIGFVNCLLSFPLRLPEME